MKGSRNLEVVIRSIVLAILRATVVVAMLVCSLSLAGILLGYYNFLFIESAGWFALPMVLSLDLTYVALVICGVAYAFIEIRRAYWLIKEVIK